MFKPHWGHHIWSVVLMVLLTHNSLHAQPQRIRYLQDDQTLTVYGQYPVELLRMAMAKTEADYGAYVFTPYQESMRQQRQFNSLGKKLDVVWTVTTKSRERNAIPVRIPLLKGLIGYRVFLIHKDRQQEFDAFKKLSDFAPYTAVQGHDWPDVGILRKAGLKVDTAVWHPNIFRLVSKSIVDYFPRSVTEVEAELEYAADHSLAVERKHLFYYPSALYFFVAKGNNRLAKRIELGLRNSIKDGDFDKLFYSYPTNKRSLSILAEKHRIVHRLENPYLPANTPLKSKELWLSATH